MALSKQQEIFLDTLFDKGIDGDIEKAAQAAGYSNPDKEGQMSRKRLSSTIPFGWRLSDVAPGKLEPVREEQQGLERALDYISKGCSIKEVARWLHASTDRYISDKGLKFIFDRERG